MRLRNNPNAMLELKKSKYLVSEFPVLVDNKTIIEIGMGKGEMITELAKQNPDRQYIGIEKYPTVAHKAMKRAEQLELQNFKIICEDVANLPDFIKGKVSIIWLTFSDPWPKARHEKRRLTYIDFLKKYSSILNQNGILRFKTDNDKLFEYSVEHMRSHKIILKNITRDFHSEIFSKGNVMTGYEKKWSETGKKINYFEAFLNQ